MPLWRWSSSSALLRLVATPSGSPVCRLLSTAPAGSSSPAKAKKADSKSASMSSALRFQQRTAGKKKLRPVTQIPEKDRFSVVGYSTAHSYDLLTLGERLEEQGIYEIRPLVTELLPECLYARAKYTFEEEEANGMSKDVFFFENGSVVFWSFPEIERDSVLKFLRKAERDRYDESTIEEEAEMMAFNRKAEGSSELTAGEIRLRTFESELQSRLEKYAFSNGMASSVKLGALESSLDRIIDSIEHLSEDLKRGRTVMMTRDQTLQKAGEIFALRHVLNLSSDLLDTPDFYWDREDLERLYHITCSHLAVGKRTRVMNEKLTHCVELMDLIRGHLNDEHHVRLEWFIIVLILIEVVFEVLHFVERFI